MTNYTIREVKYFHPSGLTLPNGSHYQKGGFLNECHKNKNNFVLDEDIPGEPYGMTKYRGGVIVFAVNVTAAHMPDNKFVHSTITNFNNDNSQNGGEHLGIYSFGSFFKGKYVGNNEDLFDNRSICLKINGVSSNSLLKLAEMIAERFKQKTVLAKDLNRNKIYSLNKLLCK